MLEALTADSDNRSDMLGDLVSDATCKVRNLPGSELLNSKSEIPNSK